MQTSTCSECSSWRPTLWCMSHSLARSGCVWGPRCNRDAPAAHEWCGIWVGVSGGRVGCPCVRACVCARVRTWVLPGVVQERKDAEGNLFFVLRSKAPFFRILVLNRLSPTNFVVPITRASKLAAPGQYFMIRDDVRCRFCLARARVVQCSHVAVSRVPNSVRHRTRRTK